MLLEELDKNKTAILNPDMVAPPIENFPKAVVTCFSKKLLEKGLEEWDPEKRRKILCKLDTEDGGVPVYGIQYKGTPVALYMSRVGAPACGVQLEDIIARGGSKVVMLGSCGVLDGAYGKWQLIFPTAAARDEGLSYHYIEASDFIEMQPDSVTLLGQIAKEHGLEYAVGKVWTTDALYRETAEKTRRRREAGCIAVDMECAAVHAIAQFREIKLAQFFYAEDHVDEEEWNSRGLSRGIHLKSADFLKLALECAVRL